MPLPRACWVRRRKVLRPCCSKLAKCLWPFSGGTNVGTVSILTRILLTNTMPTRIHLLLLLFLVAVGIAKAQGDSVTHVLATEHVSTIQFSHDGKYFLALDSDALRVFSLPSGKQLGTPIGITSGGYADFLPGDSIVLTIAYSSDTLFNSRMQVLAQMDNSLRSM